MGSEWVGLGKQTKAMSKTGHFLIPSPQSLYIIGTELFVS